MQWAHEGGKVRIAVRGRVDPFDAIGNRTTTFRPVAQCLNQLRHRVPPRMSIDLLHIL